MKRKLPEPKPRVREACFASEAQPDAEGWVQVCAAARFAARRCGSLRSRAKNLCRSTATKRASSIATDGLCTHGNTHLSDGLVKGGIIECPKHNGRFNLIDGSPARAPICRGLATYPVEERDGRIFDRRGACRRSGSARADDVPVPRGEQPQRGHVHQGAGAGAGEIRRMAPSRFAPGDYLQLDIPAYDSIRFSDFDIPEPYAAVWQQPACLRPGGAESAAGQAQQLLAGRQSANGAAAAL